MEVSHFKFCCYSIGVPENLWLFHDRISIAQIVWDWEIANRQGIAVLNGRGLRNEGRLRTKMLHVTKTSHNCWAEIETSVGGMSRQYILQQDSTNWKKGRHRLNRYIDNAGRKVSFHKETEHKELNPLIHRCFFFFHTQTIKPHLLVAFSIRVNSAELWGFHSRHSCP